MKDLRVAENFSMKNIDKILKKLSIDNYDLYGKYKAKINGKSINKKSKIILVTAINPTKYGEGKTTVAIGLNDALNSMGHKSLVVLREPSMGPVFGIKGGATGGGYSQVVPANDINLHFTGDLHAISSANNLISACIDNSIYFGNPLKIKEVWFKRCLDVNDRSLRDKFNITAASEVMAVFCLAKSYVDLRERLGDIIIGINETNNFVYVRDLNIVGSLMALLKDAFKPNLVQTLYNNPALIHGGPFANIAHGCSSVISLSTATNYSDYVVTEAGFGSDAGGFKFLDIVMRNNNFNLGAVVLVATIRALKHNGNGKLEEGLCNLGAHINNLKKLGVSLVVTLNEFVDDTKEELQLVREYVLKYNVDFAINNAYLKGYDGCVELANAVLNKSSSVNFLYDFNNSLEQKIEVVAKEICHARKVLYSDLAKKKMCIFKDINYPINFAKTQYSFSDNAKNLGNPEGYDIMVTDIQISNGAKFIIVYLGNIISMPGLSKLPNANFVDVQDDKIVGII